MVYAWIILTAMAMAQTSQPAGSGDEASSTSPPVTVAQADDTPATGDAGGEAARPEGSAATQPGSDDPSAAQAEALAELKKLAVEQFNKAASVGSIGDLSGNPVEVEVTSDGTIILYGDNQDLEILEAFIEAVDKQPIFQPTFKVFPLKSADVSSLAKDIQRLWNEAKKPVKGQLRAEDRISVIPEPRSNSLLVAATKDNMEQIAAIIDQLDQPSLGETVQFEPVQLHHVKAVEAEKMLQDMMESLRKRRNVSKDLFTIKADARTNMLLISAPEADLEQIKHLISLIDVEPSEESGAVVKMAVYPLEKAEAEELAEVLSSMLQADGDVAKAMQEQIRRLQVVMKTPDGGERTLSDLDLDKPIKLFPDPGTNSIIVATVEKNLDPLAEIIRLLDSVPLAGEVVVRIFPLEHADAESLVTAFNDIFDQGANLSEQPGKTIPGRIPQGLAGEALAYNIGFSADKRTNTVIVSGTAEQILLVKQIVQAVDVPQAAGMHTPRVVRLEHADVTNIAEAANKLADQHQKIAEQALSPTAAERERILVVPDVRTNSLIIVGNDENYERIANLAKELDSAEDDWLGQIQIVNLTNLTATDIADKIEQLWERRAELRREGGLPEDKPVIVADTRSNSLVIASRPTDYEAIIKLVRDLESQELAPMADIRLITLEHNDVTKVAELLNELFEDRLEMSLAKGQDENPADRITVIEDPLTRTLLVASSKSNFDEIQGLVAKLDVPPSVGGLFKTFLVQYADVSKTAEVLEELFEDGLYRGSSGEGDIPESATKVTIVPDLRSSSLIASGSPQNLTIVEALLKELDREDVPNFPTDAKFFRLDHADVINVADIMDKMFEGMRSSMDSEQQDQLEVEIIPDTRSNTLIVTGTRYAIRRAETLVPELDKPTEKGTNEVRVYTLKQASASRIEPVITELFEERKTEDASGKRTPIHILAEDESNTLIVTASAEDQQEVEKLVNMLDIPSDLSAQMHVVPLAKARADQLADMLKNLVDEQQGDRTGGFAVEAEERTNSLLIWAAPSLMRNVRTIIAELDNTKPKAEMGLRVYRLQNAKAEDLSELLNEFFEEAGAGNEDDARQMIIEFASLDEASGREMVHRLIHQDVTIAPDKNTNALMVLAPLEHIDMMEMLIAMLDRIEPVTSTIQVFTLRNADATEMKELLDDLFEGEGDEDARRALVFAAGAEGGAALPTAGPGGEGGTAVEVAFAVDERTNSLIAAGSEAYLRIVERLVVQLDYQEIEERVVRVVHLRNRPSEQVADTMKSYYDEESQLIEQAAEGEAAVRQLQRQVTIQDAGEGSNTIIVAYNPRMESQVVSMINELDRAPDQVMIQVLMAEVTLNDTFEMGMEFALQDLLFSETNYIGQNGTVKGPDVDVIGGTDIGATGKSSLGGISFTVTGEDFNFLIRALQVEGRLEILSRPSIMCQDNQEANITVGERVPTVQDVVVSTGGVITPSVTYEDVGVILDVTPIVNPDGYVSMEIKPEISAIGTSSVTVASGVSLPTFTERSAETSVTVKDGETIIIGGLITSRDNDSENKAPLIGDIPVLGNLFRATVRESSKTELLIILTPHVVRSPAEARTLSLYMRDNTGMNDNIRTSPLMQGLQVRPEDDQFGPPGTLEPTGEEKPRGSDSGLDEMGPQIDEYGPPVSSIEAGPSRDSIAVHTN